MEAEHIQFHISALEAAGGVFDETADIPGVCLWSPAQIFKQVRGVLATTDVSSMLPYC